METRRNYKKILLRGVLLTILCLLFGFIDGFRSYFSAYYNGTFFLDLSVALRWDVPAWTVWIAFIPLVLWLCERFPVGRDNWFAALIVFLPVGLAIAATRTFLSVCLNLLFFESWESLSNWLPGKPFFLFTDFVIAFVFYAVVLAFGQATNYYKRYREEELRAARLESQLSRAELSALKMQLQPHFLFNALNSISALQLENTEAAQEMTARLGDFLRMTLENAGTQEVTLEREIEFLRCYLEIEKVRFGRRLTTEIEIEPAVLAARVPNLILQPIVENSLKHGIEPRAAAGKINIRAIAENGWVRVEVRDNGKGIEGNFDKALSGGLGLSNTESRLRQLYGANFRFDLQNAGDGDGSSGLLVTLRLPREKTGEEKNLNGENRN